jgi:hypothetical protein
MKRFATITSCLIFAICCFVSLTAQIPTGGSATGLPSGLSWAAGVFQVRDAAATAEIRSNGVTTSASVHSWYYADAARVALTYNSAADTFSLSGRSLGLPRTTVTFSVTPTFVANLANNFKITLTGNVTSSTLSVPVDGQYISFLICQDATGSRTFVWPSNVKGGGTIGATLSTCSAQSFVYDGVLTNAYAVGAIVTGM